MEATEAAQELRTKYSTKSARISDVDVPEAKGQYGPEREDSTRSAAAGVVLRGGPGPSQPALRRSVAMSLQRSVGNRVASRLLQREADEDESRRRSTANRSTSTSSNSTPETSAAPPEKAPTPSNMSVAPPEKAPDGGGGPPAPSAAPSPDASGGGAVKEILNVLLDKTNLIRTGFELGRAVPVWGLASGGAADALAWREDDKTIEEEDSPTIKTALKIRHGLNGVNNVVGHITYVNQLAQDGLLVSVAGAPGAAITASANEVLKGTKVVLDQGVSLADLVITWAASARLEQAKPGSKSAENWEKLRNGFVANLFGDTASSIVDIIDFASGGTTNGEVLKQGARTVKALHPAVKFAQQNLIPWAQGIWNVYGGDVVKGFKSLADSESGPEAAPATPVQRASAGGFARQAALAALLGELQAVRGMYGMVDAGLGAAGDHVKSQLKLANEGIKRLSGGKDAFSMARDMGVKILGKGKQQIDTVTRARAFAVTSGQAANAFRGVCDQALGAVNSLRMPPIKLEAPNLGGGTLGKLAQSGTDLANRGLKVLVGKLESAIENVRTTASAPIQSIRADADLVGATMKNIVTLAGEQIQALGSRLEKISEGLKRCTSFEQAADVIIQNLLSVLGLESDFKIDDLRQGWAAIGPFLDKTIAMVAARASGQKGGPAPEPAPGPEAAPGGVAEPPPAPA